MKPSSRRFVLAAIVAGAMAGGAFLGRHARADQPQMQEALDALRSAENHLEKADRDKGGHREKALDLVRRAIAEVKLGVQYDRHH